MSALVTLSSDRICCVNGVTTIGKRLLYGILLEPSHISHVESDAMVDGIQRHFHHMVLACGRSRLQV